MLQHRTEQHGQWTTMNYPAASSEVSLKDGIYFIVASDGVFNPQLCNKGLSPVWVLLPWEMLPATYGEKMRCIPHSNR